MAKKTTRAICRWCHADCRIVVHSENGKLIKTEEDPTDPRWKKIHPPTKGCVRQASTMEHIYHPDRIKINCNCLFAFVTIKGRIQFIAIVRNTTRVIILTGKRQGNNYKIKAPFLHGVKIVKALALI